MKPKTVAGWMLLAVLCGAAGCASAPKEPEPALPTSAQAGDSTVIAVAAGAPCCKTTLPEFLGLKGLGQAICGGLDRLRNRLGMRFPGLEARPPVLAITDPANMDPNAPPSVQAAAEVKAEKDAAAQKVKAIRYLATIGCSQCYPDVETGLLEATKDCTEEVRYEAVKALREAAGNPCCVCRENSCCTVAVMERLYQIAHECDEQGCPLEPSARVRRVARLALNRCGCPVAGGSSSTAPEEGPAAEPVPEGGVEGGSMAAALPAAWGPADPVLPDAAASGPVTPAAYTTGRAAAAGPVLARVSGQPILMGDVLSRVDRRISASHPQASLEDRDRLREELIREELERAIDTRLLCDEARRYLPAEEYARVAYHAEAATPGASFPEHLRQQGALDPAAAEALAAEWLRRCIRYDSACPRQELYAFYRTHLEDYRQPPQLRWEQLAVPLDRVASREQARAILAELRSRMLGENQAAGMFLNRGAVETMESSWTSLDQLPAGPRGAQLTALPEGVISGVIEDRDACYLVRVLERRDALVPALDDIAQTVRDDLLRERRERAVRQHLAGLRGRADIWTVYDADPRPVSLPAVSHGAWASGIRAPGRASAEGLRSFAPPAGG